MYKPHSKIHLIQAFDLETYSNKEVIAIDQDPLGVQGRVIFSNCPPFNISLQGSPISRSSDIPACQEIWAKPLANKDVAMNLVNFAATATAILCDTSCFEAAGLSRAHVRDVWAHADLGVMMSYSKTVGGNGASVTLRLTPA